MLPRSFRVALFPVCALAGLLLVSGCASKRHSTRVPRSTGHVLYRVTPEQEYNPPAEPERQAPEPIPLTPPAPRDADPPPPTRSTSDIPPAPPRDDFESAERPGRHSASFGPYTGHVVPASKQAASY